MLAFIKQIFCDDNDRGSMMRLLCFEIITIKLGLCLYLTLKSGSMVSLGYDDLALILSALGAKVVQKGQELKSINTTGGNQDAAPAP